MSNLKKCLYFDDEIKTDKHPLDTTLFTLNKKYGLEIDPVDNLREVEIKLKSGNYCLILLDIRIDESKGGGIGNREWQRTGIELLTRIRNGIYEPNTPKDIPVIVITAVADAEAQSEIISIGKGENEQYKIALFEKPADDDEIGITAKEFLDSLTNKDDSNNIKK
jgi:CheY-like chemotaxis protein